MEDEAYYWMWSRDLAAGYFDHPPMVAFFIRAGTELLGPTALGVRLASVVAGLIGSLVFYRFCRDMLGPAASLAGLVFFSIGLLVLPFTIFATPDAPLLLFWILSLWTFHRAVVRCGLFRWVVAGAAVGLCILSKYNGFMLPIIFLCFLVFTARGRRWLRSPAPYAGLLTALLVASPNILWTASHGGVTFLTPAKGAGNLSLAASARQLGLLVGHVLVGLNPVLLAAWVRQSAAGLRRSEWRRDESFLFCCCASWLPLVGFGLLSLVQNVHAQWIATCLVAAIPVTFRGFLHSRSAPNRLLRAGLWTGAGLLVLASAAVLAVVESNWLLSASVPKPVATLAVEARGQKQLAARIRRELAERPSQTLLMSADFHFTSLLGWLAADTPAPVLPLRRKRFGQYEFWYRDGMYRGWDAVYVDKYFEKKHSARLRDAFEQVTRLAPEPVEANGRRIRQFEVFSCRGFRGPLRRETPAVSLPKSPSGRE
ncbi:MAG: glycosyltransferase family 39 protein [Planctomycetota bacterium]